jgi:multiple sugar transport system substrate-binding protein
MGAKLYEDGDYTHTALNSPEGVAALTKLVEWYNNGYIIPGVTTISNSDLLNAIYQGQAAITGGGLSLLPVVEGAQQEGKVTVEWDPYIATFPHAEGVQSGGMAAGPTGAVVFKQDDPAKRKWAIEFARFLASPDLQQQYAVNSNQFPSRISVGNPFEGDPNFTMVNAWIQEYGVEDMGLSSPTYAEVRVLLQPELQAAFLGKKTPEEALASYEEKANAVLAQNK